MLELPEIETLRRDAERDIVGKRIKSVEVPGKGVVNRHPTKKHFASKLDGTKITGVLRRGTLLLLKLDSGEVLVVDLRAGGQLRRTANRDEVSDDTQAIITFTQAGQLRFLDDEGGLALWVTTAEQLPEDEPAVNEFGLDPVETPISWTTFARMLLERRAKLRPLLLDPTAMVGIGPVYADEILHAAGLRHDRSSEALSAQEMRRLYRAVVEVLHEAVKHRGSTLVDMAYADLAGRPGGYQGELKVVEREGLACARCRAVVVKTKIGGRSMYACPACQV